MTDGICRTVVGTEFSKNDGTTTTNKILSFKRLGDVTIQESEIVAIGGIDSANYDRSLDGYWMNDLTITRISNNSDWKRNITNKDLTSPVLKSKVPPRRIY